MKTIKLSIIFLTIVNCVFLALNMYYYGMKSGSEDPNDNNCIVVSEKEDVSEDCMMVETEELDVDNNADTFTPTPTANADSLRLALIQYVGTRPSLAQYMKHNGYKYLCMRERIAIESYLNPTQYYSKMNAVGREKLHNITDREYTFKTINDILTLSKEIQKVINDKNNKKE